MKKGMWTLGVKITIVIVGFSSNSFSRVNVQDFEHYVESLRPARYFRAVHHACLDVGNDLDIAHTMPELQQEWSETDYLLEQFLQLYTHVANLMIHKEEARTYLREDAEFLIGLMNIVFSKYQRLADSEPQIDGKTLLVLAVLVHKSRQKIQALMALNQEVSGSEIFYKS